MMRQSTRQSSDPAGQDDAPVGADARRLAEMKADAAGAKARANGGEQQSPDESGGPAGLEPTRYGDWEKAGRCIDF